VRAVSLKLAFVKVPTKFIAKWKIDVRSLLSEGTLTRFGQGNGFCQFLLGSHILRPLQALEWVQYVSAWLIYFRNVRARNQDSLLSYASAKTSLTSPL
jgi:hypothetical protein